VNPYWRKNEAFVALAEFHWAEDYALSKHEHTCHRGSAEAKRRMQLRWEGFSALPKMAEVAERISASVRSATGA
jgi:hypothetical protein